MQFLLFELFLRHLPSELPAPLAHILPIFPVLAGFLPVYIVLSFLGILARYRILITIFFICFFVSAVFLSGTLLTKVLLSLISLPPTSGRWSVSELSGAVLILILLGIAIKERIFSPRVYRHNLKIPGLSPEISGLTVLHMSDLHVGSWQSDRSLQRIAMTALSLAPDILVFTGDMIDHNEGEIRRFENVFGAVNGQVGTFAVLGNHEYWTLGAGASDRRKKEGVPVLKNEFRTVKRKNGTVWIVGIDDPAGSDVSPSCGPDTERAYKGVQPSNGDIVITLVHQPTLWEGEIKYRSHLTLSGHTHGGQMGRRRERWSLARFFFLHDVGLFRSSEPGSLGHYLHVSAGMGYYGIPIRIGMGPEMTIFTLQ
jgi:hypothetical protein